MKISDFDIYHLPPLMGMFVDYIENVKDCYKNRRNLLSCREKTMSYWMNTHS